jgi:hypothetical protein
LGFVLSFNRNRAVVGLMMTLPDHELGLGLFWLLCVAVWLMFSTYVLVALLLEHVHCFMLVYVHVDWPVRLTFPAPVTVTHIVLTSLRQDDSGYLPLRFLMHFDDATSSPKTKPASGDLVRDRVTRTRSSIMSTLS